MLDQTLTRTVSNAEHPPLRRRFEGIDVFVEWHGDVGGLVKKMQAATLIGDFRLSMISNRDVVMWPNVATHTVQSTHWRCRFNVPDHAKAAELEVPWLLSVIGERIPWTHVEKLKSLDGVPAHIPTQRET